MESPGITASVPPMATVQSRFSKQEYLDTIEQLRRHILKGDCYEINLCQEFYCRQYQADPSVLYQSLSQRSPTPFAAYYKNSDKYLICASPERYLKKSGRRVFTQPIKGTLPRDAHHANEESERRQLQMSAKDRSENIMVVDLVRNDLSRICEEGSVTVEELFGIYSFPRVHQMISTVSGYLPENTDWVDVIRSTFPMGSMTGAPKKRVLELIEQYERTRRGLYSGAVGYCTPERDFDFNVVIRSMLYQQASGYLSFQVGSAITWRSDAEQEFEECRVKASAMRELLSGKSA